MKLIKNHRDGNCNDSKNKSGKQSGTYLNNTVKTRDRKKLCILHILTVISIEKNSNSKHVETI